MQKNLLDTSEIERLISRISIEILEKTQDPARLVIVGIKKRGDILADRIAREMESLAGKRIETSAIDITFYRDDLQLRAYKYLSREESQLEITDRDVLLVDDVISTGRSIRAAIDALIDSGRPKSIQLAVLIDRGGREFPIQPDYCGKKIQADLESEVLVKLKETDDEETVIIAWDQE